jgi:hypothetical protein
VEKCFRYWNGKDNVFGDPIEVYERLVMACGTNPQVVLDASNAGKAKAKDQYPSEEEYQRAVDQEAMTEPQRVAATLRLRQAVRIAFEMAPPNPKAEKPEDYGATAEECDQVLREYWAYCAKKNASGGTRST